VVWRTAKLKPCALTTDLKAVTAIPIQQIITNDAVLASASVKKITMARTDLYTERFELFLAEIADAQKDRPESIGAEIIVLIDPRIVNLL
jgi:hypothetical protein